MRVGKLIRRAVISLATLGMCLPQLAVAQATAPATPAMVDVVMADGGVLNGKWSICKEAAWRPYRSR